MSESQRNILVLNLSLSPNSGKELSSSIVESNHSYLIVKQTLYHVQPHTGLPNTMNIGGIVYRFFYYAGGKKVSNFEGYKCG